MNVLSLFDGMGCGRIALDRLGKKVDQYFSSEVRPQVCFVPVVRDALSALMITYPSYFDII